MRRAAALGQVEFWTLKPWRSPDEDFHSVISAVLREWARCTLPRFEIVRVVGEQWTARSHEIRDLLGRNNVPHGFYPAVSDEGRRLLEQADVSAERLPVLVLFDGRILVDPTNAELGQALGVQTAPQRTRYDVVVVGAGPSGLAASVYATSEGLRTALLEREAIGGQAGTTSLIRNYLGFPRGVSGGELATRAYEQAWLFGTEFIYGNKATGLRIEGRDRIVTLADGSAYHRARRPPRPSRPVACCGSPSAASPTRPRGSDRQHPTRYGWTVDGAIPRAGWRPQRRVGTVSYGLPG